MQLFHVSLISASMKLPGPFLSLNDTWLISDSPQLPPTRNGLPYCLLLGRLPETSLLG